MEADAMPSEAFDPIVMVLRSQSRPEKLDHLAMRATMEPLGSSVCRNSGGRIRVATTWGGG
jgi:hypothetical protein